MPVIAIGAAIGATFVAGSAVAATVGGIAAISAVTALEVTAAVGATVGAIGAVTGNKTLSMVGTAIGAVGAIGGLAAGAGLLGSDAASSAPLFGAAPTQATADAASSDTIGFVSGTGDASASGMIDTPPAPPGGVGAVDPTTGDVISQATSGAAAAPAASSDTITLASTSQNAADPATTLANAPTGAADSAAPTGASDATAGGLINTTPAPTAAPDATAQTTPPVLPGQTGPATSAAGVGPTPTPGSGLSAQANPELNTQAGATEATGSSDSGMFGSLLSFAKSNPVVALGALQAGGSLLSGLTSTLTPAQVTALSAQAAANDAAAALTKQQTANLAAPKSVASSAPVTGAPAPLVPPTGTPGMINSAQQPQVTGKPA